VTTTTITTTNRAAIRAEAVDREAMLSRERCFLAERPREASFARGVGRGLLRDLSGGGMPPGIPSEVDLLGSVSRGHLGGASRAPGGVSRGPLGAPGAAARSSAAPSAAAPRPLGGCTGGTESVLSSCAAARISSPNLPTRSPNPFGGSRSPNPAIVSPLVRQRVPQALRSTAQQHHVGAPPRPPLRPPRAGAQVEAYRIGSNVDLAATFRGYELAALAAYEAGNVADERTTEERDKRANPRTLDFWRLVLQWCVCSGAILVSVSRCGASRSMSSDCTGKSD